MRPRAEQAAHRHPACRRSGRDRRKPEREQQRHPPCTSQRAEAEHRMKPRHERSARRPFDLDRMDVHRDIERAERRAERHQRDGKRHRIADKNQKRQHRDKPGPAPEDQGTAADARGHPARDRHREDRAEPEAEQQDAKCCIIHPGIGLGKGHERGPGRHGEPGREEGEPRCKARPGSVGALLHDPRLHARPALSCRPDRARGATGAPRRPVRGDRAA
jgi:hypothetical protein